MRGSFDAGLDAARALAERGTHVLVNSVNPHRVEGQKTAAFEIVEELGGAPDVLALPYGGGGNTLRLRPRLRRGRRRHAEDRRRRGGSSARRRLRPRSGSREPVHAEAATEAVRASGGAVVTLGDEEILAAWSELAHEGLFCEPASAAGLAALGHVEVEPGSRVVCVLTGHGLKDPAPVAGSGPPPVVVDPDPDAIAEASR